MPHLTLNTGWIVEHPLSDSDEAAVEQLRALVPAEGGPLAAPHGAVRVQIARQMVAVCSRSIQRSRPDLKCAVATAITSA